MRRLQVTALKEGRIRKPVVAWVSGTCAKLFKSEVQFGHAGAKSGGQAESAQVTLRIMPGTLQLACAENMGIGVVALMWALHAKVDCVA